MTDDPTALQAEIADLRKRNAELERRQGSTGRRALGVLRVTAVILLMTIGSLLATVSVPAIWGRNLVLNTDRYVQTLAPLAGDPGIQAGVIKAIDKQFNDNVDIGALARQVLPERAGILAGPLESAAQSLINTVATRFVQSPAFATLWTGINRVAHTQVVAVLTGNGSSQNTVAIKNDTVTLNLGPIVEAVKTQLVNSGLSVASRVPTVGASIELAQVKGVDKARSMVRLLDRAADWLPLLAIGCLVVAVALSRRRRRSTIVAALSVALGMTLMAAVLAIGRSLYLGNVPGIYLSHEAAKSLYNTLVRYLRDGLRLVLGGALLSCLIAWLTGPAKLPTTARKAVAKAVVKGPRALVRKWEGSRPAIVLAENRGTFAGVVFGVAALVLVLWSNPTVVVVVVIAFIALAFILLAYLTGSPAQHEAQLP